MNLRRIVFASLMVLAFVFSALSSTAQEKIDSVIVTGNHRVEQNTVASYVSFRAGQNYNAAQVTQAVKDLYGTGLFSDVSITFDEGKLSINVKENPVVNRVVFEGNEAVRDDRLKPVISMQPRGVYTPAKAQQDVQEILAVYRQTGRFLAKVEPQLIERDQNRVDVIYKISEQEKTRIESIRFVGNKRFGDADLRNAILTKESAWWRFLSSSDSYDPDRIEADKEMLRRHYVKAGYADFKVVSAVTELSRDKTGFFITFTISEGPSYKFGAIDMRLNADEEGLTREELLAEVKIKAGDRYDGQRVDNVISNLFDYLGAKGYAFLDVQPRFMRNEVARTIDVTFTVEPGPRVYVNRINIHGNTRTQDHVIRRQMRFAEGDAFSTNKLKRSKDRLTYLSYFSNVEVEQKETEQPDRVNLDVEVTEQSTGEFQVGAGFSTFEGAVATADVRERNFLGKGQDLSLGFSLSGIRQDFNFSFTEPWFLNQDLSAGIDLFNRQTDYQSESSYDLAKTGGGLRFGFPVGEFTKNFVRFGYQQTKVENVDVAASQFVKADAGKKDSLTVGNTFSVDTRDSFIDPTKGYRGSIALDYSGFGSDIEYIRTLISGSWHHPLSDGVTLHVGARAGTIIDLNDNLPTYEHFSGGGDDLRGFDRSGIGPRDATNGDALGGKLMFGNNVEVTFPIAGLTELGVKGVIFTDGGIVTDFRDDHVNVTDSKTYRMSAGAGIHWKSPMGPLRLEFGIPVVKASEDQTQIFSFSFGARF